MDEETKACCEVNGLSGNTVKALIQDGFVEIYVRSLSNLTLVQTLVIICGPTAN